MEKKSAIVTVTVEYKCKRWSRSIFIQDATFMGKEDMDFIKRHLQLFLPERYKNADVDIMFVNKYFDLEKFDAEQSPINPLEYALDLYCLTPSLERFEIKAFSREKTKEILETHESTAALLPGISINADLINSGENVVTSEYKGVKVNTDALIKHLQNNCHERFEAKEIDGKIVIVNANPESKTFFTTTDCYYWKTKKSITAKVAFVETI